MAMEKETQKVKLEGTVDTCPVCGYTDGFHVSFKIKDDVKTIILICPQCHSRFDPGWKLD
jgi:transcription elongation factor Elf1